MMKKLLMFTVANDLFAVDMASVSHIAGGAVETPVPDEEMSDGQTIPEQPHDLFQLFEYSTSHVRENRQQMLHVSIDGKQHFLKVDRINGVFECPEDRVRAIPTVCTGPAGDCFPWVVIRKGQIIPVLDITYAVRRFTGRPADTEAMGYLRSERSETHG